MYLSNPLMYKTKYTIFGHRGHLMPYKEMYKLAPPAQNICNVINYNCAKFHSDNTNLSM